MTIKELSDTDLRKEWEKWNHKILAAHSWGAALAAADEFRKACELEMKVRGMLIIEPL